MRTRAPLLQGWRLLGSFVMDRRPRQTNGELPSCHATGMGFASLPMTSAQVAALLTQRYPSSPE